MRIWSIILPLVSSKSLFALQRHYDAASMSADDTEVASAFQDVCEGEGDTGSKKVS